MSSATAFAASVALIVTTIAVPLRIIVVLGRRTSHHAWQRAAQIGAALFVVLAAYLLAAEAARHSISIVLGALWAIAAMHLVLGRARAQRAFTAPVSRRTALEEQPVLPPPSDAFSPTLRLILDSLAGVVFVLATTFPIFLAFPGHATFAAWIDAALGLPYATDTASIIGFAYLAAPVLLIFGAGLLALVSLGMKRDDRPIPPL